jgi:hypothetical protein
MYYFPGTRLSYFFLISKSLQSVSQILDSSESSPCNIQFRILVTATNFHEFLTSALNRGEQSHPFVAIDFPIPRTLLDTEIKKVPVASNKNRILDLRSVACKFSNSANFYIMFIKSFKRAEVKS